MQLLSAPGHCHGGAGDLAGKGDQIFQLHYYSCFSDQAMFELLCVRSLGPASRLTLLVIKLPD